jgi:hypothetical protein
MWPTAGLNNTSFIDFTNSPSYSADKTSICIKDNLHLNDITLKGLVSQKEASLEIGNNGPATEVMLHDLETPRDVSISGVKYLRLPRLYQVYGFFEISNNTIEILAADNFTTVRGNFRFTNNNGLETLDLPLLRQVGDYYGDYYGSPAGGGGLLVKNNSALGSSHSSKIAP